MKTENLMLLALLGLVVFVMLDEDAPAQAPQVGVCQNTGADAILSGTSRRLVTIEPSGGTIPEVTEVKNYLPAETAAIFDAFGPRLEAFLMVDPQ